MPRHQKKSAHRARRRHNLHAREVQSARQCIAPYVQLRDAAHKAKGCSLVTVAALNRSCAARPGCWLADGSPSRGQEWLLRRWRCVRLQLLWTWPGAPAW